MVIVRSVAGMKELRTFNKVVLPAPEPPETTQPMRAFTAAAKNSAISGNERAVGQQIIQPQDVHAETPDRQGRAVNRQGRNHRIDSRAVGQRASTIGLISSILRPSLPTIRWMIRIKCCSSAKIQSVSSRRPCRST